jgi:ribosome biogenesis GTPase
MSGARAPSGHTTEPTRAGFVALIGAPNAGKSTLLNALMGEEVAKTGDVRAFDNKGRHTTTSRHLHPLPWGAMLIDTPGTRELGLIVDDDALDTSFADVAALAETCRYRDCVHEEEPGCAVQQAVRDGTLSAGRLAGYQKQRKEMRWLDERQQGADHEQRARGKRFAKMVKESKRLKNRS